MPFVGVGGGSPWMRVGGRFAVSVDFMWWRSGLTGEGVLDGIAACISALALTLTV